MMQKHDYKRMPSMPRDELQLRARNSEERGDQNEAEGKVPLPSSPLCNWLNGSVTGQL